jgi:type IV pilus modification protein PilV
MHLAIRQAIFMAIYTNKMKAQQGIGLIEVLIAAVVIAVGLLSLASLQGELMHSSGESKARSEAVKLAEEKLEQFRNNILKASTDPSKSSFDVDLATGTGTESINGSNATFARSWTLTDATSPDRKNISVKVTWGGASADETVNMVSQVVWADPGKATDYATDGNGLAARAPSPNNNSSSTPAEQFDLDEIDGETALDDDSGLFKYTDDTGRIYLLDSTGKAMIKFNGGSIHTIKGNVYAGNVGNGQNPTVSISPLTSYPVTFSDLAYCVFPVHENQSDYICYFGGDCTNGGNGCVNQDDTVTYTAVSGGWYGKVGLIETSDASFHNKKVCFAEDIAGTGIETATTTARLYLTQRLDANNNVVGSEGINQSFACQDFLVVRATGNSNDCNRFQNFDELSVPSSTVYRSLGPDDINTSQAENVSSCGSIITYTVAGNISGDQANLVQVFVNGNGCTITSNNNNYTYQCTITVVDTTASVTITATGGSVAPNSTVINVSTSQPSITGPALVANDSEAEETEYHITGSISGNQAGSVTLTLTDGTCTTALNADSISYSYECTITATPTTITINASGGDVTLAMDSINTVNLADAADVDGPDFVAAAPTLMTYVITGAVTGHQADSIIFNLDGGSCTNNYDNTYTCTITSLPGDVTINVTGGNVQQVSGVATLAGVTAVTGPSFNSNNLTDCNVTVTGNIAQGISGKDVTNGSVRVTSSPAATPSSNCSITNASGNYSYSCAAGTIADSGSVTIGGSKVAVDSVNNPVSVSCTSSNVTIIGPSILTTN